MTDRTRIAVCRGAFLALCVVPTLLTIGFIAFHFLSIRSPAAKAEWQRELSQRLGVAVSIGGLSYPQPSIAELSNVRLADAETGQMLAECRRVQIQRQPEQWQVTLFEPSIRRDALVGLLRRLHDRLLLGSATSCRFAATQLVLTDEAAPQSIHGLLAELNATNAGPAVKLQFSLSPHDPAPAEVTITRNRQVAPPATRVEWKAPTPLPANFVGMLADVSVLGPRATISGTGSFTLDNGTASGELAGQIDRIDLSRLIGEQFPHVLTGQASLNLDHATFTAGRLASARGTLAASGGGRIGRSLLESAIEHLHLAAELPPPEVEAVAYSRLAIGFDLTDEQLHLSGIADTDRPNIVLTQASGPLLTVPENHQASTLALVRTLAPDSQVQVPATKQTAAFLTRLPLPALDPPQTARRTSHTPTRLAPASPGDGRGSAIREKELR